MNNTLVVLGGPTASGKTTCAIKLAQHFHTEIISADSRQIYKETTIGTAVPSAEELQTVPHHFIQSLSVSDYYNASMYELDVLDRLRALFKKHQVVILSGGSGLYINAVCNGIDELPTVNPEIRKELANIYEKEGLNSIQDKLKKLDADSYEKIDLNNHLRILKALEVCIQTGRPYSSFLTRSAKKRDFRIARLALNLDRTFLYEKINRRVDQMMESGLLEEVKSLNHLRETPVMKTVGYRELFRYLDGKASLEEAIDLIKRNTRKYARKQITWFRKDQLYPWFSPEDLEKMLSYINSQMK